MTLDIVTNGRALRVLAAVGLMGGLVLSSTASVAASGKSGLLSGLVITGHGYGPGVGLSQWGAEERAKAGQTHEQILSFYYPGTVIGTAPSTGVRILVAQGLHFVVGSGGRFRVVEPNGTRSVLAAGRHLITTRGFAGRRIEFPLRVLPAGAPLTLGSHRYRGIFEILVAGSELQIVNSLPLERYVAEVVSAEDPASWSQEALRSQAIASRSYALANLHASAPFDLYADNRSQNYRGLRKEYASAVEATNATKGQVLLYDGAVVSTFFTAANGGMTSNTDGVWRGPALPYLDARPDPFDARGPDTNWGPVRVTMGTLRRKFPRIPVDVVQVNVTRNSGDRMMRISFTAGDGSSYTVDGRTFQQRLRLRSTFATLSAAYGR